MSDIPKPPNNIQVYTYADDINTQSSHKNVEMAQNNIQPYLEQLHSWTKQNNVLLNPDKSTSTLFTQDSSEYNTELQLKINNIPIPTNKHPKTLGLILDPKLTYTEHIKQIKTKALRTTNIMKALTGTQ